MMTREPADARLTARFATVVDLPSTGPGLVISSRLNRWPSPGGHAPTAVSYSARSAAGTSAHSHTSNGSAAGRAFAGFSSWGL